MKKLLMFLLVGIFLSGIICPAAMDKDNLQIKKQAKLVESKKIPHLRITLPKENTVYYLPDNILLKAKLSRVSRVRFIIRNPIGEDIKEAYIEEADLVKSKDNTYTGQVKISLKLGKYFVIAAATTNLGPDSLAVGPVHFSVARLKKVFVKTNWIKITSPEAGKDYYIGYDVPIEWDTEKIAKYGYVHIQICWPDGEPAGGTFPVQNTGSHVWEVKETAENSLRLKIFTHDKKYSGMTGTFNIKFPRIKKMPKRESLKKKDGS